MANAVAREHPLLLHVTGLINAAGQLGLLLPALIRIWVSQAILAAAPFSRHHRLSFNAMRVRCGVAERHSVVAGRPHPVRAWQTGAHRAARPVTQPRASTCTSARVLARLPLTSCFLHRSCLFSSLRINKLVLAGLNELRFGIGCRATFVGATIGLVD